MAVPRALKLKVVTQPAAKKGAKSEGGEKTEDKGEKGKGADKEEKGKGGDVEMAEGSAPKSNDYFKNLMKKWDMYINKKDRNHYAQKEEREKEIREEEKGRARGREVRLGWWK
jgi:hypothetical protein